MPVDGDGGERQYGYGDTHLLDERAELTHKVREHPALQEGGMELGKGVI